jgi:hypothetical protein
MVAVISDKGPDGVGVPPPPEDLSSFLQETVSRMVPIRANDTSDRKRFMVFQVL